MKKKAKKEKKSNRHKSSKKKRASSSSESASDSDAMEWVEVTTDKKSCDMQAAGSFKPVCITEKKVEVQRDAWMSVESLVPTLSKEEMLDNDPNYRRRSRKKDLRKDDYKPGQHERELNPYWKNDGKGIPKESEGTSADIKLPSTSVGDGGLSWLRRAYKRIEEQSAEENRSMDAIAVERWGSLDKLKSLIEEAEEKMGRSRNHDEKSRYRNEDHDRHRWRKDHYKDQGERNLLPRSKQKSDQNMHEQNYSAVRKNFTKDTKHSYEEVNVKSALVERSGSSIAFRRPLDGYGDDKTIGKNSSHREMFKRPTLENPNKREELPFAQSSDRQPAWMKKKEVKKMPVALEQTEEKLKTESSDLKESPQEKKDTSEILSEEIMMTDDEMNILASKIFKAEMRGNNELAAQLQIKLDAARNAKKSGPSIGTSRVKRPNEEVILSKTDSHGISRPLVSPDFPGGMSKKRQHKGASNDKYRSYFSEESEHSLKKMFEKEKLTTADDQLEMYLDAAMEERHLKDQDYEIGDVSAKISKKMSQHRQDEKDYNKAIKEHMRRNTALENCEYCIEKIKTHLIISESQQVCLCLPSYQSLVPGHCLIVPKSHVSSSLLLDEDVAQEIQDFKKKLIGMFRERDECVAFVETCMDLRYSPHLVIECLPMPTDVGDEAPLYFRKAIQEQGSEWANNKKVVDLFKKDLRHSIPKGLPFFAVEFSQGGGYAHVIEDREFSKHFGKEIVGGMLEIDSHLCSRYRKEDFKEQSKKILQFSKNWKSYCEKENVVL